MITIQVRHNFETAHRLPFLEGKCENIHGHSWWASFDIGAVDKPGGIDRFGISVEYGQVKKIVRDWIDKHLDHGAMLGTDDALLDAFQADRSKVFIFGRTDQAYEGFSYDRLPWPTVEAVAQMLSDKIQEALDAQFDGLYVNSVYVKETHVNSATYIQGA